MSFTSLTAVLFLLQVIASLAAVDPNSLVLNDLAPGASENPMTSVFDDTDDAPLLASVAKSPPNDAFTSAALFAADPTTSSDDMFRPNDVLASGAEVPDSGNNQAPDGECLTDNNPPTAQKRVRRGCTTSPMTQQSTEGEGAKKPETESKPAPEQPQLWNPDQDLPVYKLPDHSGDFGRPRQNWFLCDPITYGDLNTPMCDSGFRKRRPSLGPDIQWIKVSLIDGIHKFATLLHARPWMMPYGCVFPEVTWCCKSVTIISPKQYLLKHDWEPMADYTANKCVRYIGSY